MHEKRRFRKVLLKIIVKRKGLHLEKPMETHYKTNKILQSGTRPEIKEKYP